MSRASEAEAMKLIERDLEEERQDVILAEPSAEDLNPTESDRSFLEELFDWEKRSSKTRWVLGQPVGK